jgi:excisionase family DNA binding protein
MSSSSIPTSALYVRVPATTAEKLDRAAHSLGVPKKELVVGLISRYVNPDDEADLGRLATLAQPRRVTVDLSEPGLTVGTYSYREYPLPEVLTAEQAGQLLQLPPEMVIGLAGSGELPGRRLGGEWRFSKAGLLAWLAGSPSQGP